MTIVFLCAPVGILAGLVIGIISSVLVRRQGLGGFFIAQGWSLLIVCGLAGLLVGVPYALSDKPPRIDGKRLELSSSFGRRRRSKFQINPTVTASKPPFALTVFKVALLSSIGAPLKKMPNTLRFRELSRY
jgi:hypothetical protein